MAQQDPTTEEMRARFEEIFAHWQAREIAHEQNKPPPTELMQEAWREHVEEFLALWPRWHWTHDADSDEACYALLAGDHSKNWVETSERAECLLEVLDELADLRGLIRAAAAMAEENAYLWLAWLDGTQPDTFKDLREIWENADCPASWHGIGVDHAIALRLAEMKT